MEPDHISEDSNTASDTHACNVAETAVNHPPVRRKQENIAGTYRECRCSF